MAWLTVQQARGKLNDAVSVGTIYRLAHGGTLKATKIAGKILIDSDSLDSLILQGQFEVISPAAPVAPVARPAPARAVPLPASARAERSPAPARRAKQQSKPLRRLRKVVCWVCGTTFETRWHHAAHYATLCSDPCRVAWKERKKKGIAARHPNAAAQASGPPGAAGTAAASASRR